MPFAIFDQLLDLLLKLVIKQFIWDIYVVIGLSQQRLSRIATTCQRLGSCVSALNSCVI